MVIGSSAIITPVGREDGESEFSRMMSASFKSLVGEIALVRSPSLGFIGDSERGSKQGKWGAHLTATVNIFRLPGIRKPIELPCATFIHAASFSKCAVIE